jgi:hypothetical protein
LSEGSITRGSATVIFSGTSNCWNTAREAGRLVKLYPQFRDRIRFVIVDLNHAGPEQEPLVSLYYHGFIPTITAIDSQGNVLYDRAGETAPARGDTANLWRLLDSVHKPTGAKTRTIGRQRMKLADSRRMALAPGSASARRRHPREILREQQVECPIQCGTYLLFQPRQLAEVDRSPQPPGQEPREIQS